MVYREVSVIEIREALRAWLAGKSERAVARQAGVDRKTGKRYVTAAVAEQQQGALRAGSAAAAGEPFRRCSWVVRDNAQLRAIPLGTS